MAGARQDGRPRHRRHRAAHGVCRQRPAGRHAGIGGARPISTTTASRSASNVGVYTANDSAYAAAIDLKKAGVDIAAIVDLRDNPHGPLIDEARALGIEINDGRAVVTRGGKLRVSSMVVQPKTGGGERTIPSTRS